MIDTDGLTISNPGGFIEGISEDNLLSAQPRSRNPRLALILKTAGYAEQTGRGVDKIYIGSLANGGAMPDSGWCPKKRSDVAAVSRYGHLSYFLCLKSIVV